MRSYSSREVIAILKADEWYEVDVTGKKVDNGKTP